jgi:hypothetical protein
MRRLIRGFTESTWDRCYDFLNIFAKKIGEKMAFLTQNKAKLFKNVIITFFSAENCQESQKIVIITSTYEISFGFLALAKPLPDSGPTKR